MIETPHQFITVADGNTAPVLGSGPLSHFLSYSFICPFTVPAPLRTYARRVKQTIDKVIPTTSHSPLMAPTPDDLPIALRKHPLREALAHPGWKAAMNEEMQALWENGIWDVVPTPP
ncbi:hypothetical protein AKJ16_DCAP02405 [Drosera capensis]